MAKAKTDEEIYYELRNELSKAIEAALAAAAEKTTAGYPETMVARVMQAWGHLGAAAALLHSVEQIRLRESKDPNSQAYTSYTAKQVRDFFVSASGFYETINTAAALDSRLMLKGERKG